MGMRFSGVLAVAALATIPSAVLAQVYSGAVSLGYARSDVSDISNNITTETLDGRIGASFGNGFTLGARFDGVQGRISGVSGHLTATDLGVSGNYQLPSNFRIGAYAERAKVSVSGLSTDLSATSVGLTGGYAIGGTTIDGFYGTTTTNPDLPSGVHIHDYGIKANYSVGSKLTLGGNFIRTRINSSGTDVNFDTIGVAGAYAVTDKWTVFGGLRHSRIGLIDGNATTVGVGASYDLSSAFKFASYVSIEYEHTKLSISGSGGSLNTMRVGFTIPFGPNASKTPLNSVADAVMSPTHSAISTAVLTAF
ncbi:MAG: porin [Rhodobacteraceae bacterium]|nr:porin [Paracoccaceae bacterium]